MSVLRKIGKKAMIGTTLTWVVAIMLIVFLMALFLVAVGLIKTEKISKISFSFGGEADKSNPVIMKHLINFLDTPVIFESKEKNAYKLIILMVEPYLKEEFLKEARINDINLLGRRLASFGSLNRKEILLKHGINEEELDKKNKEIINKLNDVLNNPCKEYLLQFPLGYLYKEKEGTLTMASREKIETLSDEGVKSVKSASIKIPYDKYVFMITYKEKEVCKNEK